MYSVSTSNLDFIVYLFFQNSFKNAIYQEIKIALDHKTITRFSTPSI